ncbi:DNA repair protein RAD51 3 [Phytophthora citrophthora]|uniref:DNA repair protein RAD51 homolog 3 n=1 Tax=Phytophthora citrophthora TaxID=4793 RepID=A0AAD9GP71_9STRA|nr:DNA repair protein RAD51 3 [Phytophthora citrophthora]
MATNAPLAACGLAPSILGKQTYKVVDLVDKPALFRAGFRNQKDLMDISARELASETQISVKEAVEVLEVARNEENSTAVGETALNLLQEVTKSEPIATRLMGIDGLLGGGLQQGEVTEICGGPGTGKTQFGMHVCLAAQYSTNASGKPASVVFIDSEGSFIIERVASMAEHFLEDFRQTRAEKLTRDDVLRGISYYRVHDYLEQMEVLYSLPAYFQAAPECKLLVIDTVAFHFRHGFEDYTQRARALDDLASFLHGLATDFDVAVLLINHITTKASSNDHYGSHEQPALGTFDIVLSLNWFLMVVFDMKVRTGRIQLQIDLFSNGRGIREVSEEEY